MVVLYVDGIWLFVFRWFWCSLDRALLLAMTSIGHYRR